MSITCVCVYAGMCVFLGFHEMFEDNRGDHTADSTILGLKCGGVSVRWKKKKKKT